MMRRQAVRDAGFTLVELLVSMTLIGVLGGVLASVVAGTNRSTESTNLSNSLNEEARVALNRLSRELRESQRIVSVLRADGTPVTRAAPDAATSITFHVDFNGDRVIADDGPGRPFNTSDPEVLTYCFDSTSGRLLIIPNQPALTVCNAMTAQPLVAANVSGFTLQFRSSRYEYGQDWPTLDASSVGDASETLTSAELRYLDSVVLGLSVLEGAQRQDYRTQVDLRNQR